MTTTEMGEWTARNTDEMRATIGQEIYELAEMTHWIGQNPDLTRLYGWGLEKSVHCKSAAHLAEVTRILKRGAPLGSIEKTGDDNYLRVRRSFGRWARIEAWVERTAACERVQVGEETVEIPDPEAPKVTVTRPKFEWQCEPILTATDEATVEAAVDEEFPF